MPKPAPLIRGGFSVAGSEVEYAGEVAIEVNGQRPVLRPEFDPLDQATDQFGGFGAARTTRQCLAQRGDLVPVTARHVRVKQDRIVVSRGELPLEFGLAVFELGGFLGQTFAGNPVHDRLHDPVQFDVDLRQFTALGGARGAALDPQAVHVPRVFFGEYRAQGRVHQVPLQTVKDRRLERIAPDGQPIAAGAFVPRGRAAKAVLRDFDKTAAATAAFE